MSFAKKLNTITEFGGAILFGAMAGFVGISGAILMTTGIPIAVGAGFLVCAGVAGIAATSCMWNEKTSVATILALSATVLGSLPFVDGLAAQVKENEKPQTIEIIISSAETSKSEITSSLQEEFVDAGSMPRQDCSIGVIESTSMLAPRPS